jgi:DNA polymerase-3 subunit gamma/tau
VSAPVQPVASAPAVPERFEENRPPAQEDQAPPAIDFVADEDSMPPPWDMDEEMAGAVAAPAPAPVRVSEPAPAVATFEASPLGDDWTALVNRMVADEMIAALPRELALQSELRSQLDGVWTLRVERESLTHTASREKLQLALQAAVPDSALRKLEVELGPVGDTPARRNAAAQLARQREAEAIILNDPFVQDMMRDWGAKIVPGSIKPVKPAAPKPI